MSPNEECVLGILATRFGGEFKESKRDPPDGYIITPAGKKLAVEVSRLVEETIGEDGAPYPRLKDDVPVEQLANEIEVSIGNSIPDGVHVLLTMSAPINNFQKTNCVLF